jgi:serine protease Do
LLPYLKRKAEDVACLKDAPNFKGKGGTNMFSKAKMDWGNKKFRWTALTAVAISFLFAGLLLASPFQLTKPATAGDTRPVAQETGPMQGPPGSFADLVQKQGSTVVNIRVTKIEKTGFPQEFSSPEGPYGELFRHFFRGMPQPPETFRMQGAGSGVIISRDGYIVTNHHVVEGAKDITVTLADREEYKARIVGRDPKTDLAVLKIDPKEVLNAATLGNSEQLKVGEWVLAIGNPFGLSNTVTAGIVSAKGRIIGAGPYDDFIQTDASINPGNSGGPLFNLKGEVVGINTAIVPNGQGIGFAIPVNMARPLIPQLISKGEVTRGYIGVSIQVITPELAKAMNLKDPKGALVSDVVPGSPADKGGLKQGDVIIAFNQKNIDGPRDLSSWVAQTAVGQEAKVTILREGNEKQLTLRIEKLASEKANAEKSAPSDQGKWGLGMEDLNPQMKGLLTPKSSDGVMVANVQPGSPADLAGVRPGDILLSVNRQPVHSTKQAVEVISKAKDSDSLLLLLRRDEGTFFAALAK